MRLRDDVVLEKVSGIYVLVALRSAWGECPFAMQLAPHSAVIWNKLRDGAGEDEIFAALASRFGMNEEKCKRAYSLFVKDAVKLRYALPEADEE